jgi:hypothetical protein
VIPLDGLLGSYDEGDVMVATIAPGLPADALVLEVTLNLAGWSIPGLYHDATDPDETIMEYWGQISASFPALSPRISGWLNTFTPTWSGDVDWYVSGGVFDWSFLTSDEIAVEMQNLGPSWVGFPVFHRELFSELTGAVLTITYERGVPNEAATFGQVKSLWR